MRDVVFNGPVQEGNNYVGQQWFVANIVKFYRALAGDEANRTARYFRGVGNDGCSGFVEKTINGATGGGEKYQGRKQGGDAWENL